MTDIANLENNVIPGTQSIWIKTWGCSHNISDSEYMAGLLSNYGYNIITNELERDKAHLWLLNSCTVKGPSEAHFLTMVRKAKVKSKYIVASGCVPQGDKKINEINGLSVVGVQQIDRIVEVVEQTLKGNTVQLFSQKRVKDETGQKKKRKAGGAKLDLPKIRKNKLIEIIPINTGCLNQCTYCKTKHARGDLGSYSTHEIINRIKNVINEGIIREIWLTSEDTGAYGLDINTNISNLLNKICNLLNNKKYKNKVMIRIGMTNPPYILNHLECVVNALNHPNIYSFLHIPVQSASNNVLDSMKRKYHLKDFERVCDHLIENVPRIHLATDFICGFPTENENDHKLSLNLLNKYKFTTLNISQFYPRPSTPAARNMKKLDTKIVKNRSREMTKLFKSYINFGERIGEIHNVLITEMAKDGFHFVGHNKCFDHFLVPPSNKVDLMGKIVQVKIVLVGKFHLKSKIVHISNRLWVNNGLNSKYNNYTLSLIILLIVVFVAIYKQFPSS
eukprot:478393_1